MLLRWTRTAVYNWNKALPRNVKVKLIIRFVNYCSKVHIKCRVKYFPRKLYINAYKNNITYSWVASQRRRLHTLQHNSYMINFTIWQYWTQLSVRTFTSTWLRIKAVCEIVFSYQKLMDRDLFGGINVALQMFSVECCGDENTKEYIH